MVVRVLPRCRAHSSLRPGRKRPGRKSGPGRPARSQATLKCLIIVLRVPHGAAAAAGIRVGPFHDRAGHVTGPPAAAAGRDTAPGRRCLSHLVQDPNYYRARAGHWHWRHVSHGPPGQPEVGPPAGLLAVTVSCGRDFNRSLMLRRAAGESAGVQGQFDAGSEGPAQPGVRHFSAAGPPGLASNSEAVGPRRPRSPWQCAGRPSGG
jgi:hypothetical protein